MTASQPQPNTPRSVYIGKLGNDPIQDMLTDHLNDIGVSQVSDVIKLNCTVGNQASFCVIVDNDTSEAAIYDPTKWPQGVCIRPYKQRQQRIKQTWQGGRNRQGG